jgi:hypothetical protein
MCVLQFVVLLFLRQIPYGPPLNISPLSVRRRVCMFCDRVHNVLLPVVLHAYSDSAATDAFGKVTVVRDV